MTELPFEILQLISQSVWPPCDLLQLQLVSKRWYEASSESLYSVITIKSDQDALSYIRTISNSQKLGSYLKTIFVHKLFSARENNSEWDKNDLLNTLAKYCFNLSTISVDSPHYLLWVRLMHAAAQGKFPNLQRLPSLKDEHIELYVCTALAFRKSLTTLHLVDRVSFAEQEMDKINLRAFQELGSCINEFQNLRNLSIKHHTSKSFNLIVDPIIDNCPKLIELDVFLYQDNIVASTKENVIAIPQPNIRDISCVSLDICKDDQLKYFMRKFPNLEYLSLASYFGEEEFYITSYDVMMEFMEYISSIKIVHVEIRCEQKYIVEYYKELVKLRKAVPKELYIRYEVDEDTSLVSWIYYSDITNLVYTIDNTTDIIPHEEFLRENGSYFEELTIVCMASSWNDIDDTYHLQHMFNNGNWIYQILQLCPSLQIFKLEDLANIRLPADITYQHTELKKLEITDEEIVTSYRFLRNLSFNVPNLKELEISSCHKINNFKGYCIEIDMPYTTFNLITVTFGQTADVIEDYYIKLNTVMEETYYFIDSTGRHNLTSTAYEQSHKHCLFKITCHGLKTFQLIRKKIGYTAKIISRQIF